MSRLSDSIERLIKSMLAENDGKAEISRNELADQMNCVPSQITYVISTRFTNNLGYIVESRRGGGGSIKIRQVVFDEPAHYVMHTLNALGDSLSQHQAQVFIQNLLDYEIVDTIISDLLNAAVSTRALTSLGREQANRLRAEIFKNMLTSLIAVER